VGSSIAKRGLILGAANLRSAPYCRARQFRAASAELALTEFGSNAGPFVRPLATEFGAVATRANTLSSGPADTRAAYVDGGKYISV
jgi:enoyl-[acyl-carrier-protein] reductase (NADH)